MFDLSVYLVDCLVVVCSCSSRRSSTLSLCFHDSFLGHEERALRPAWLVELLHDSKSEHYGYNASIDAA